MQNKTNYSRATSQSFRSQDPNYVTGNSMMGGGGERVRVTLRIRPMMDFEIKRQDQSVLHVADDTHVHLNQKGGPKQFRFNAVLPEPTTTMEVFSACGVNEILDSALDGYSATVFAYGQTGSGKTFTMLGNEQQLAVNGPQGDANHGLFLLSVRYLFEQMTQRNEQFYIKASFLEIYNEQLRDLLNPASGVLHARWNAKNGFFVEDLMVVECTSIQDLNAVMFEGIKNRHQGSHELNKDSSRSHSILTVYLISETENKEENHIYKKYGKISFVDLAGSERLKESLSEGTMAKETGQINKSLFTLGKVISMLASKEKMINQKYIPFRDSKLTMLLQDSLGGTSRALLIACVSPAETYADETISTLNFATRTMNIKNKPIVQMDAKEQIIFNLKREVQLLQMENQYLKGQILDLNGGRPIEPMPQGFVDQQLHLLEQQKSSKLPPINSASSRASNSSQVKNNNRVTGQNQMQSSQYSTASKKSNMSGRAPRTTNQFQQRQQTQQQQQQQQHQQNSQYGPGFQQPQQQAVPQQNDLLNEYMAELQRLKVENNDIRFQKDLRDRDFENVMFENAQLQNKLENLENVFIGSSVQQKNGQNNQQQNGIYNQDLQQNSKKGGHMQQDYKISNLIVENNDLKKRIFQLEQEKLGLQQNLQMTQSGQNYHQ